MGGVLYGSVREGPAPAAEAELRDAVVGAAEVVRDINKFSNNVMAQQLFLTLAAQRQARRAGHARRRRAKRCGAGWWPAPASWATSVVIDNGSGLSRETRISALRWPAAAAGLRQPRDERADGVAADLGAGRHMRRSGPPPGAPT
jgi:D-alanyl-D-alanine carboxypeptidase/D-alanyl-D-alanine-endopeptidase (penicillin-binding protein 4)